MSDAHTFYPFVEGSADDQDSPRQKPPKLEVNYPARIAVYDDPSAAPRVVVIEPKGVREYLEEITATVVKLAKEQGSVIPFMVIREVVENFIHSYFRQPTISILDGGNTIRFSDQGPGIKEKSLALEYGTSSATEEMKQYIRGVGSGLPYVQQYLQDKGGSLTIEDNISGGTIVTISAVAQGQKPTQMGNQVSYQAQQPQPYGYGAPQTYQPQTWQMSSQAAPGTTGQTWRQPPQPVYGYPSPDALSQGYPPAYPPQQGGYQTGGNPPASYSPYSQGGYQQQSMPNYAEPSLTPPLSQVPGGGTPAQDLLPISDRGRLILSYLVSHDGVGPTELTRQFGHSQPTWSRELQALEEMGLIAKRRGEQKRTLTPAGRAVIAGWNQS